MSDDPKADQDLSRKAKAKASRQAAYQKAKILQKERKAAYAASDAGKAQQERQRAYRQDVRKKAKKRREEQTTAAREVAQREQEIAAASAASTREAELLQQLTTADQLRAKAPKLRLVKRSPEVET